MRRGICEECERLKRTTTADFTLYARLSSLSLSLALCCITSSHTLEWFFAAALHFGTRYLRNLQNTYATSSQLSLPHRRQSSFTSNQPNRKHKPTTALNNMASRKRSTLSDIDGAGVPKRLRAEGVHDSHERDTEALTEATNNAPLGEETRAVTSEQQGATDKGGEPYEVRQAPYLVALHSTDTAHRMTRQLLLQVPPHQRSCTPQSFWNKLSLTSPVLPSLLLQTWTSSSSIAQSILQIYRRPCAYAPASDPGHNVTGYTEQARSTVQSCDRDYYRLDAISGHVARRL